MSHRPPGFLHVLAGLATIAVLGAPSTAAAHPDVVEGRRLAQRAELERAMAAFDRAEASGELDREDLVALLEGRALVHHALGATAELDQTLEALASITPEHRMGRAIPPDVVRAFERAKVRVREPVSIVVTVEASGVRVSVDNDVASVARELRVHHRTDGGEWETARGQGEVVVPRGGALSLHAVAIGPGGAPIATRGSEASPEQIEAPQAVEEIARPELAPVEIARASVAEEPLGHRAPAPRDEGEGLDPWPFVAIGGAVIAVGIAVAAVLLLVPGNDTQPSFPRHPL